MVEQPLDRSAPDPRTGSYAETSPGWRAQMLPIAVPQLARKGG